MPIDNAEKQRSKRAKKKAAGLLPLNKYVTPKQKDEIESVLRGEAEIVYKPGMKK